MKPVHRLGLWLALGTIFVQIALAHPMDDLPWGLPLALIVMIGGILFLATE